MSRGQDRDAAASLRACDRLKELYTDEMDQVRRGGKQFTPLDVNNMVGQLYKVPKYGEQLKEAIDKIEESGKNAKHCHKGADVPPNQTTHVGKSLSASLS